MTVATKEKASAQEVAAAWDEYLESTRGQDPARYTEVESWAWSRLKARLRELGVKVHG